MTTSPMRRACNALFDKHARQFIATFLVASGGTDGAYLWCSNATLFLMKEDRRVVANVLRLHTPLGFDPSPNLLEYANVLSDFGIRYVSDWSKVLPVDEVFQDYKGKLEAAWRSVFDSVLRAV